MAFVFRSGQSDFAMPSSVHDLIGQKYLQQLIINTPTPVMGANQEKRDKIHFHYGYKSEVLWRDSDRNPENFGGTGPTKIETIGTYGTWTSS